MRSSSAGTAIARCRPRATRPGHRLSVLVRSEFQTILDFARDHRVNIPRQGAVEAKPEETADEFRIRVLTAMCAAMQMLVEAPARKIVLLVHGSAKTVVRGWLANDTPNDFSIDPGYADAESEVSGRIDWLFPTPPDGSWFLSRMRPDTPNPFPPGIYLFTE